MVGGIRALCMYLEDQVKHHAHEYTCDEHGDLVQRWEDAKERRNVHLLATVDPAVCKGWDLSRMLQKDETTIMLLLQLAGFGE